MTERWSPLLTNSPELAGPLLSSLRRAVPSLFEAAIQAPEAPTRPIAVAIGLDDDPSAQLSVIGRNLSRGEHGPRDALFMSFTGRARLRGGSLPIAGDAVLDLATNAILRLRLSEPMAL